MFHVCSTSIPLSCALPLVNAGSSSLEQRKPTESLMSKPRSAKMVSPGTMLSSSEQCSVKFLSHLFFLPIHLKCNLLFLEVQIFHSIVMFVGRICWARANKLAGRSKNISKQSIIQHTVDNAFETPWAWFS